MNETQVKIEPEVGSIPEVKTQYWYIWSCMCTHCFKVKESEWIGGMSDSLRLAKGNVYLNREEAEKVCDQLNNRLDKIRYTIDSKHQQRKLKEEAERKKREAAERKAEREKKEAKKKKVVLSDAERKAIRKTEELLKSEAYEKRKKKRQEKSPHPDIII